MEQIEQIKNRFFNNEFVEYKGGVQGMYIDDHGKIVMGNRAGPSTWAPSFDIKNLVHEMSHMVEIDDARMRCHGWGLKLPQIWVYDRYCCEPITKQITDRELRVAAYQVNLLKHFKIPVRISNITSSLEWLADTCFVPLEDGQMPYSEGRTHNLDYTQIKTSQARWRVNEVKRLMKEFTAERFISEWDRKINWLGNNPYVVDNGE